MTNEPRPRPRDDLGESGRAAWALLARPPIAHRGLWNAGGPPENALPAFEAACAAGFGIELDVQLAADGVPVVFHDDDLRRMTGRPGRVADHSADHLAGLDLLESGVGIPTLRETLSLVAGRVLVLVEIKTRFGNEGPLERAVAEVLDSYGGPVAVIGFNPASHAWFAEHRPSLLRGLNSYAFADARAEALPAETRQVLAGFETVGLAQPDFILPGLDILHTEPVARLRRDGLPVVAWTVRTTSERLAAAALADNIIGEGEGLA